MAPGLGPKNSATDAEKIFRALTVQRCMYAALSELTDQERRLTNKVAALEHYTPMLFEEQECVGATLSKSQRYRFLKNLRSNLALDIMRYDPGGGAGCVVFIWKVPANTEVNVDTHATQVARLLSSLEAQLPPYHTRQMRKEFYNAYGRLSGLTPSAKRLPGVDR